MKKIFLVIFALFISPFASSEPESKCFGETNQGRLENGWKLPASGKNFHAYSSAGVFLGRTYVHSKVYRVILGAYDALLTSNPNVTYIYGETGFKEGGTFKPHKTHTNGLSVDFFVPVVDERGKSAELDIGVTNKFGYNIEFDKNVRFKNLKIDFESIAKHIDALNIAAKKEGVGIKVVIFDNDFQKLLFETPTGKKIKNAVNFSVKKPWVRHDEHYHVDFDYKCL